MTSDGRVKIQGPDQLIEVLKDLSGEEIVVLGKFQDGKEYYFEVKVD
jgi:hypothetical protein